MKRYRSFIQMFIIAAVVAVSVFSCSQRQEQQKPEETEEMQMQQQPQPTADTLLQEQKMDTAVTEKAQPQEEKEAAAPKKEEAAKEIKKPAAPLGTPENPLVGEVVDIAQLLTGGEGKVNREQALQLVERGQPIGVLAGNVLYLVYNPDGSYAGKKLARFANAPVGIVGRIHRRGGWSVIIADLIESYR